MIQQFSTSTEMISFLKSIPTNWDYRDGLKSDFGIDSPEDANPFHREYFYKYLVQGSFLGKVGDELYVYAKTKTIKFAADFPEVIQKYVPNEHVVEAPRAYRKSVDTQDMHGVIVWSERYQKYDGYVNGKVVTRASTVEKCNKTMKDKYGIEGVAQGD